VSGTPPKQQIAAIEHVFATGYETDSDLGVLARGAVEGFDSDQRLWQVIDARSSKGARALLQFLTEVPTTSGQTTGQFAAGFSPDSGPVPEALAKWNAILAEAFEFGNDRY
jgi:hypothetical protein